MSGKVLPFDGAPHHPAQLLLPWFVNGTLDTEERAQVDAHLAECALCRTEVRSLQTFQASYARPEPAVDTEAAFARLCAVLDGQEPVPPSRATRRWLPSLDRAMPWAAVAAFAVIGGGLLLQVVPPGGDLRFRTLGATATGADVSPGSTRIAVVFDADLSEARLRAAVQAAGARIVDGPTTTGAYVLETPRATQRDALDALRATSGVRMAEPLDFTP